MQLLIALLITAQIAQGWKSQFARVNKTKRLAVKVKNKTLDLYSKEEWTAMLKSLQPKLDGPVVKIINDSMSTKSDDIELGMRIIKGRSSSRGQNPYQVGILIGEDSFCGGALISGNFVITAAHCLEGNSFTVILGAQNRSGFETGRMTIETSRIIMHPKWNSDLVVNDLALLPLPYPIPESNFIKSIRLPKRSSATASLDNNNVTVCGWGKTSDEDAAPASNLACARTRLISNAECTKLYGSASFKSTNLCGRGLNQQSTCSGDSGGPVVLTERDKLPTLIGIVSYGAAASCEDGYPDVFTRVSSYLSWITNVTGIAVRR
ncbi:brachyurin-like [Cloeon dipterum]|uniref:brachyurin-like n=1 Tax=Cloeon dipterum TaxID=197152 RepID=UPI0032201459